MSRGPDLSRNSSRRRWLGVALTCVLGALIVARCETRPSPASGGRPAPPGDERAAGMASGSRIGRDRAGPAIDQRDPRDERARAVPTTIIALPSGDPPVPGRGSPEPLAPEVEQRRQMALAMWQRDAARELRSCFGQGDHPVQPTTLTVFMEPRVRAQGEATQVVAPRWVSLLPPDLERLSNDIGVDTVQSCLLHLQATSMTVALSGAAIDHEFPSSAENVVIEL